MPLGPLPQAEKNFANWLAGFTDGDGGVSVSPNKTSRLGFKVHAAYFVCQHKVDQPLLEQIKNRLGCGFITSKPPASLEYVVSGKSDLVEKILRLFSQNTLCLKTHQFDKFKRVIAVWTGLPVATLTNAETPIAAHRLEMSDLDTIRQIWQSESVAPGRSFG